MISSPSIYSEIRVKVNSYNRVKPYLSTGSSKDELTSIEYLNEGEFMSINGSESVFITV